MDTVVTQSTMTSYFFFFQHCCDIYLHLLKRYTPAGEPIPKGTEAEVDEDQYIGYIHGL